MSESERKQHVAYQAQYFDEHKEVFRRPIPDDVVERTKDIITSVGFGAMAEVLGMRELPLRVLDVGTGMGVLIPHLLAYGIKPENIVGCDLSSEMLAEAHKRFPKVTFWQGDFAEMPADFGHFDFIWFNACFGNFFDPDKTIERALSKLAPGGRIVISHPMGNEFVRQLRSHDPKLVLRPLPAKHELDGWCERWGLRLETFRDEPQLYLAVLAR